MKYNYPLVGVGIMIFKGKKVLLGKRKGSHGIGEYAFPGGHLKHLESIKDCARRETFEETGIQIKNIKFLFFANVTKYKKYQGKHYAHIGLTAEWKKGKPKVFEPERSEQWNWYPIKCPPKPLFEMCKLAYKSYKTGKKFFDSK